LKRNEENYGFLYFLKLRAKDFSLDRNDSSSNYAFVEKISILKSALFLNSILLLFLFLGQQVFKIANVPDQFVAKMGRKL
jgi:hypothetical protein